MQYLADAICNGSYVVKYKNKMTINSKSMFVCAVLLSAYSTTSWANAPTVADFHADKTGCETCHANAEPSLDGGHEFAQCQSCHGTLASRNALHKSHDGMLMCSDCHTPHDLLITDTPTCDACHDDGRSAITENK